MADENSTKDEGTLQMRKRSNVEKFANSFIKEDAHNIGSYIVKEVIIPAFKKIIDDVASNTIHMALYGSPDSRSDYRRRGGYYDSPYGVTYTTYGSSRKRDRDYRRDYDDDCDLDEDPTLETFGQAEYFKAELEAALDHYKILSIASYKDILKNLYPEVRISLKHTDTHYGWTQSAQPRVERTRDGRYMVRMPKAMPIDD